MHPSSLTAQIAAWGHNLDMFFYATLVTQLHRTCKEQLLSMRTPETIH